MDFTKALGKSIDDVVESADELALEDQFFGRGVQLKVIDYHLDDLIDNQLVHGVKSLHQFLDRLIDQGTLLPPESFEYLEVCLHEAGQTVLLVQVLEL